MRASVVVVQRSRQATENGAGLPRISRGREAAVCCIGGRVRFAKASTG